MHKDMIIPDWPAPHCVKAISFTKGTTEDIMTQALPTKAASFKQVHGTKVLTLPYSGQSEADGFYTKVPNMVCVVLTADCLPIFLCNKNGTEIALLHAGWRGLSADITKVGIEKFESPRHEILAWLGPAICQEHYEVGQEVYEAFITLNPKFNQHFKATKPGHYLVDLYAIAKERLHDLGIQNVYGGDFCTFHETDRFYSYRREAKNAGRLWHTLWISPE